jgi:hypothetical protein
MCAGLAGEPFIFLKCGFAFIPHLGELKNTGVMLSFDSIQWETERGDLYSSIPGREVSGGL